MGITKKFSYGRAVMYRWVWMGSERLQKVKWGQTGNKREGKCGFSVKGHADPRACLTRTERFLEFLKHPAANQGRSFKDGRPEKSILCHVFGCCSFVLRRKVGKPVTVSGD